jgi:hypothetical protein
VPACVVTPELSDLSATWIFTNRATGLSSITPQLRGGISDNSNALAVEVLLIAGVEVLAGGCLECQAFSHCEVISNFMRASFNEC